MYPGLRTPAEPLSCEHDHPRRVISTPPFPHATFEPQSCHASLSNDGPPSLARPLAARRSATEIFRVSLAGKGGKGGVIKFEFAHEPADVASMTADMEAERAVKEGDAILEPRGELATVAKLDAAALAAVSASDVGFKVRSIAPGDAAPWSAREGTEASLARALSLSLSLSLSFSLSLHSLHTPHSTSVPMSCTVAKEIKMVKKTYHSRKRGLSLEQKRLQW